MSMRTRRRDPPVDLTVYPVEEKLGEGILQCLIAEELRPLIERWLAEREIEALTGADQFIYYRQYDSHARVAPDVYVLPGVAADRVIDSWKTWEENDVVPSFALEIVSKNIEKDYFEAPERYRDLGVGELIVFDPDFSRDPEMRSRFQVWRHFEKRRFTRVEATNHDRVTSKTLGCQIVAVGDQRATTRLRIGIEPSGELFPTMTELVERERAEKERERAGRERERAARLAAEAEVVRLRAALKAKRRKT